METHFVCKILRLGFSYKSISWSVDVSVFVFFMFFNTFFFLHWSLIQSPLQPCENCALVLLVGVTVYSKVSCIKFNIVVSFILDSFFIFYMETSAGTRTACRTITVWIMKIPCKVSNFSNVFFSFPTEARHTGLFWKGLI